MLLCDVGSNYIDAKPMKDNKVSSLIAAYKVLWARVTGNREIKPNMHIMDNNAPALFKGAIQENCILQLVPPDTHGRNLAERAIQTFKSNFISILAGIDPTFPMYLWDQLLPQTILTLNLLRQLNVTPTISEYQHVHGPFDYNKMPLAPLGCAHKATNRCRTWDL
jgi:hypothetical protein